MNGLINNQKVVKGYIDKINELFTRQDYLEKQRKDFENNPDWAFTEMRAYKTYKEEEGIKTIRLNTIMNAHTFDECICQEDGMETEPLNKGQKDIKKIYFRDGKIYEKMKSSGKMVEVKTINMSWVPLYLIEKIYYYTLGESFLYWPNRVFRYIKRVLHA